MRKRKKGYRLLITAGPTREPMDPVRFISNYSTGTLGYALAELARKRGHEVTLISGPTQLPDPAGVRMIGVETAGDMEKEVVKAFPKADALVMGAAVADFRPLRVATKKIKRSGAAGAMRLWQLELIENPDIVARVAHQRKKGQVVIGFALETESLLPNAKEKLLAKDLDAIVATRLYPGAKRKGPFGDDPVDGAILERGGKARAFRALAKGRLAERILDTVEQALTSCAKDSR